jgi:hypothetical protein
MCHRVFGGQKAMNRGSLGHGMLFWTPKWVRTRFRTSAWGSPSPVHSRMRTRPRIGSSGGLYDRMRYTVKTPEGELTFSSFGEVERAWLQHLIDPEDEIRGEGSTHWRKASSFPVLVRARRQSAAVWGGSQSLWILIGIVLGSVALYFIVKGKLLIGLTTALGVALLLTQVTYRAFKRTRL